MHEKADAMRDAWAEDVGFRSLLRRHLSQEDHDWAEPMVAAMGRVAAGELDRLAWDAERRGPRLVRYSPLGERIDRLEIDPAYEEMRRLTYGAGVVSTFYDAEVRSAHPEAVHAVKFALGFMVGQANCGIYCPICMTDGAARLVEKFASSDVRSRYLPGLTTSSMSSLLEGAMFLTEKGGGSDVGGATETEARVEDDGTWRLYGEKWFCSNVGAEVIMALARPEGAPAGTEGLSLFLVPSRWHDGSPNGIRIHRIKDKLGTRSMATGEVGLEGARGYLLGGPGEGFKQMAEMLNLSRLHNAVASCAIVARVFRECRRHVETREAFGRSIESFPMVKQTMVDLVTELEASRVLTWETIRCLDRIDAGTASDAESRLHRILTPIIKLHTARVAVWAAGEGVEIFGGNGYIEDHITARLFRDAMVLPVWEGTTNILLHDAFRALDAQPKVFFDAMRGSLSTDGILGPACAEVSEAVDRLETGFEILLGRDLAVRSGGYRDWILRAARVMECSLLLRAGIGDLESRGDGRMGLVAVRHIQRRLRPAEETGVASVGMPFEAYEGLVGKAEVSERDLDRWGSLTSR